MLASSGITGPKIRAEPDIGPARITAVDLTTFDAAFSIIGGGDGGEEGSK